MRSARSPLSRALVPVSIAGRRYTVAHLSVSQWAEAMHGASGPYECIIPALHHRDREEVLDLMASGLLTAEDVHGASQRLLELVCPYRWWETYRLLMASMRPAVLGRTVVSGMDPDTLTLAQWCAGVFCLFTENLDAPGRFKFEAQLADPPDGVDDGDDWAYQDFEQMVAQARAMPGQG